MKNLCKHCSCNPIENRIKEEIYKTRQQDKEPVLIIMKKNTECWASLFRLPVLECSNLKQEFIIAHSPPISFICGFEGW